MNSYPIQLSVEQMMARSREITRVDLVDDEIIEPLTILHRAYAEEAQLDEEGAAGLTRNLLRLLTNRLWMKRDFLRHPEIHQQQLKGPLVIMGVARSGTTKLQKVLAASGDFNWLPYWTNFNWASRTGKPGESTEERIAETDAHCRWYDSRSPETRLGHAFETLEPEEEAVLSEGCFVTPTFIGYAEIPSYAQWLANQSPGIWFNYLRDTLKYLQWQGLASADKPWLLKSPNYNGLELEIQNVFPDVKFVMAHRSPLETMASMCKLVECFRKAYSPLQPDLSLIAEHNFANMKFHLDNRRANPDLPMLDARFEDIVGALPVIEQQIYRHIGIPLHAESQANMRAWEETNRMHKHGEFKYSLQELGLSEAVIRNKMADYFEFIDSLKPAEAQA